MCIKVYGFTENMQGIMEIENSLEAEQEFVNGRIEVYPINDNFLIICNEDGFSERLKPRAIVLGESEGDAIDIQNIREIIHGDCFVCRFDGTDGFESISNDDVKLIKHHVKKVARIFDSVIEIEQ